ncbi:phosphoglycolate phosphatase [Benzoatithermus flavus]|uniref:Phosphoglycolate phosphatase n=1 Tax=Benzoatithermus flavus TaxID=3108223 RepID=A0ABU8XN17_9PROT
MPDGLEALVFDLDGTLVETAADLHLVLEEILSEVGLAAPPLAAVRGMIGDGARVLIERALAMIGAPAEPVLVDRLFARFRERYAEEPCRASTPYPGARELLRTMRERGIRMGLCTNKPQAATEGLLAALDLAPFFASAIGGDRLPVRKPDPGHLAAVLADLGATPAAAVMVGDSRNDLLTARGLEVPCVLVSFGYTSVPARELGADAVIDRLADLPEALVRLRAGRAV